MSARSFTIAIVAGEVSGDLLGAGLMRALKRYPASFEFIGIGGPQMQAEGCRSLYPLESLTLMGLEGLFGRVRGILRIRRALKDRFLASKPDLFIGVDVPDFNLSLEKHLRRGGIPVLHYVSPTVWAWRQYRIRTIHKAVDRMLVMFPFEVDFYRRHDVPVTLVGHPMVGEILPASDPAGLKQELGIDPRRRIVALLPGSRHSEIKRLARDFLQAAAMLADKYSDVQFVSAMPNDALMNEFNAIKREEAPGLDLVCVTGRSRDLMVCSDVIILASGTAALEAAIIGRPMVVAYKVSPMTELMVKLFADVDYYSLPNHLAGSAVVPELMQDQCTAGNICNAARRYLDDEHEVERIKSIFTEMRESLDMDANSNAASAVAAMLGLTGQAGPAPSC